MTELAPEEDSTTRDFTRQVSDRLGSGPVATGSFGEIYRSTIDSGMEVAVKVFKINTRSTDQLMKTMDRELKVWLRLKHPTIVPLLGTASIIPPFLALVSQWMPSGTLFNYLDEKATTITSSVRSALVKGIASGLVYLHSENVIHGDLHPGNVLIDDSGNPRIADFGLATVAEDPELQWATTTVERGLHSRWHAPEVIGIDNNPERPTFKSDIYSFGSVMFFIVSGDIPWKEKKTSIHICIELSKKVIHARPRDIIPCQWDLIQRCWSLEPEDRPIATEVLHWAEVMMESLPNYLSGRWPVLLIEAQVPSEGLRQACESYQLLERNDYSSFMADNANDDAIPGIGTSGHGPFDALERISHMHNARRCLWVDIGTQKICDHSVPAEALLDHLFHEHGLRCSANTRVECRWFISGPRSECGKRVRRDNISRHIRETHLGLSSRCNYFHQQDISRRYSSMTHIRNGHQI